MLKELKFIYIYNIKTVLKIFFIILNFIIWKDNFYFKKWNQKSFYNYMCYTNYIFFKSMLYFIYAIIYWFKKSFFLKKMYKITLNNNRKKLLL